MEPNYKIVFTGYTNTDDTKPTYCQEHWCIGKDTAHAMYKLCINYVRALKHDDVDLKSATVHVIRIRDDKVLRWYEYDGHRCINHQVVTFERW